ncbi:MAG TPA: redoxin domain-containing protein [Pyrinomonadaceae bacterium]|nr:redoxin domain-containing protein [Pyrinomonadaceae bacterium]
MMRRTLFLILALSALVAPAGLPRAGATRTQAPKPQTKPDAKQKYAKPNAKPKIEVRQIDEAGLAKLLKDESERGRALLVNFWATWCTPCREEFPDLVRLEEEFGAREDFEFVTVSLDDPSDIATTVPDFLSEMRAASIPAYLLNASDPEAAIALVDRTWHGELPATFLFGRKGEVAFKHTGRIKPDEVRKAIADATAQKEVTSDK